MKLQEADLYLVVSAGFMLSPSFDGTLYTTREEAEAVRAESAAGFPTLNFAVMTLEDYLYDMRQMGCSHHPY